MVGCVAFVFLFSYRATVEPFVEVVIGTLPPEARPIREVTCPVRSSLSESGGGLVVKTNGQVTLAAGGTKLNNAFYSATVSYPTVS